MKAEYSSRKVAKALSGVEESTLPLSLRYRHSESSQQTKIDVPDKSLIWDQRPRQTPAISSGHFSKIDFCRERQCW